MERSGASDGAGSVGGGAGGLEESESWARTLMRMILLPEKRGERLLDQPHHSKVYL